MSTHHPPPPPPPRPPAQSPGPWRRFRSSPRWAQIGAWVGVSLVALIIIGAIAGDPEADQASSSTPSSPPAVTTTPLTPAPAPPPEDVDTGRMSEGEYNLSTQAVAEANEEIEAYAEGIGGECAALFGAFEAAAAIECVKEAYDGVEGDLSFVVFQMNEVRGDVAKQCRAAVDRVRKVADVPLYRALKRSRDAFVSIDADAARSSIGPMRREIARWQTVTLQMAVECNPE